MEWYWWVALAAAINWGGLLLLLVYPLAMLVVKDFVFDGWYGPFMKFRLATKEDTDDPIEPWHAALWKDWWGVGLGIYMCYRHPHEKGEKHEGTHCWQWLALGLVLFFLSYVGHMAWIYLTQRLRPLKYWNHAMLVMDDGSEFWVLSEENGVYDLTPKPYIRHAYLDCWAERMARKRAGQVVDIPPSQWPQGVKNLWPWW